MAKKNAPQLIIEDLQSRANYLYLTMIEYKNKSHLCVVDNVTNNEISAYVLDVAKAENLDVDELLKIITVWYYESSDKHPLSFEFSKLGISNHTNKIRKSFKKDYVARFIGKPFCFEMNRKPKIKRKRVNIIPSGVEIKFKNT